MSQEEIPQTPLTADTVRYGLPPIPPMDPDPSNVPWSAIHPMDGIDVPDDWDNVRDFAAWYMSVGMPFAPPLDFEVYRSDDATSIALFRHKRYQVELYLIFPRPNLPVHEHPGVEVIKFRPDTWPPQPITEQRPEEAKWMSPILKKNQHHGAGLNFKEFPGGEEILGKGFPLLAFQKWDEGIEMTTVAARWRGKTVGPRQEALIRRFNPDAYIVDGFADVTVRKDDVHF